MQKIFPGKGPLMKILFKQKAAAGNLSQKPGLMAECSRSGPKEETYY
jgi:hypothetical protein